MSMTEAQRKEMHDELKLLYSASVGEIAQFKQQQWQVTNYAIAIYAASVSLSRISGQPVWIPWVLFAVTLLTWIGGAFWSHILTASIHARRRRMAAIREKHFSREFLEARLAGEAENSSLNWFFYAVLTLGLVMAWLFIGTA